MIGISGYNEISLRNKSESKMISVCCCAINAKWDVKTFVEVLYEHNKDTEFEIVFTHDNRVDDGAKEVYLKLSEKYPQFRTVEHTEQDTINYLQWCMDLYDRRQRFHPDFRDYIKSNFEKYKENKLFDSSKNFLWTSTGILYNKAILESKGDILHVGAADFIHPINLKNLEKYVNENKDEEGLFYAKPTAVFAAVTNAPIEYIKETLPKIKEGIKENNQEKINLKSTLIRDYLQYPSELSDIYVLDCNENEIITLNYNNLLGKMSDFFSKRNSFENKTIDRSMPMFHGVHIITRKSWEKVGGFSEEWYGRSFAEDKMTRKSIFLNKNKYELPYEFSFLWPDQGKYISSLPYYPKNYDELLKNKDPYWKTHPIPGITNPQYLHSGYDKDPQYIHKLPEILDYYIGEPTLRYTNGDLL